jgi:uncharacterized protein involved in exopolysaccharide biosynthesis
VSPQDRMSLPLDGEPESSGSARSGAPVDKFRIMRALRGGWKRVALMSFAGLVVGFICAKFVMSSSYKTSALLKFEGPPHILGMPDTNPSALGPAASALDLQPVLREIAKESGFTGTLMALSARINYQVDLLGSTLRIDVSDESAEDAAQFARTVTDVFLKYHSEQQAGRLEQEMARVRNRMEAAEREAELARDTYNDFREQHGISALTEEQTSTVKAAAEMRAKSELATSEIRALEARVKSLEAQLASTPKTRVVKGSTSAERSAYQQVRSELAAARSSLSADHPRVQALEQQAAQLQTDLAAGSRGLGGDARVAQNATYNEVEQQLRLARANLEAIRERQKGLFELATKAQKRVEAFSEVEGEASALLANVKISEGLISDLQATAASLEDAMRNPTSGFVVLDPGSPPEYATRNKMKVVVFGAVPLLFFGLTLLFVLWNEFRGLRAQTPAEIAYWGKGPVLGTTTWPNDSHALEELVAGLDDVAPDAKGQILVVGGTPQEKLLAEEFATRMNHDWFEAASASRASEAHRSASHFSGDAQPLTPPAPGSSPYPLPRPKRQEFALAHRPNVRPVDEHFVPARVVGVELEAWTGPHDGQALRRAARLANRVVVLVHSGAMSFAQLNAMSDRLGRQHGVGYIVVGLPTELQTLPDRQGSVEAFWAIGS